ncbi:LacI family DNA-binding transcriptional regulator [Streptomyces sp. NPDC059499]|uniref:LacI family DNA-binding transcriptional regulator n=1 Tax=Streptomyces sp. NPDC059499 TaxID=3346852 RepID=UPI0036B6DA9B
MPAAATGGPAPAGRSRRSFARSKPVMDDVARLAGVSKQTVSRVLNKNPSVRAETRMKVLAAMNELGYRPSSSARSLASGRTRVLGVISFDAARHGPASLLTAINLAAREAGYLISSISLPPSDADTVMKAVDLLAAEGADGVIAIAPQQNTDEALSGVVPAIPLVTLESHLGPDTPVVTSDSAAGARMAVEHLLAHGHSTVWHIAGPDGWLAAEQRVFGWREALEEAGAFVPGRLIGDWSAGSGYALGRQLASRPEVTAVFASNDHMALGVLRALHEAGRRVPEDVSVIGYDDIPEAAYLIPPLTTVRNDFAETGRRALHLLLRQLRGDVESDVRSVVPVELVVRASAGPAPRRTGA